MRAVAPGRRCRCTAPRPARRRGTAAVARCRFHDSSRCWRRRDRRAGPASRPSPSVSPGSGNTYGRLSAMRAALTTLDLEELAAVVADELAAVGLGEAADERVEVDDVLGRVVGVREVRRPHEPVGAEALGERRDRLLVGVAADPAPLLEVVRRRVLERHPLADAGVAEHGVHAVEPVADPAAARLEHEDLQAREPVEHAVVEQRGELVAHAVGRRPPTR